MVCLCLVLVLYFTELVPQKHILEQAQHAMCGGDLDFVYAKDPLGVRAVLLRVALMRDFRSETLEPPCRGRRRPRIAPPRARAPVSRAAVSTTTVALAAARGVARPDIPTPVRSLSMRRRSRRRIQISSLFAAKREDAATRAACRRTNGTARGRPPVIKLHCISCRRPHNKKEEKPATALLPMKGGVVAAPRTRPMRPAPSRRS